MRPVHGFGQTNLGHQPRRLAAVAGTGQADERRLPVTPRQLEQHGPTGGNRARPQVPRRERRHFTDIYGRSRLHHHIGGRVHRRLLHDGARGERPGHMLRLPQRPVRQAARLQSAARIGGSQRKMHALPVLPRRLPDFRLLRETHQSLFRLRIEPVGRRPAASGQHVRIAYPDISGEIADLRLDLGARRRIAVFGQGLLKARHAFPRFLDLRLQCCGLNIQRLEAFRHSRIQLFHLRHRNLLRQRALAPQRDPRRHRCGFAFQPRRMCTRFGQILAQRRYGLAVRHQNRDCPAADDFAFIQGNNERLQVGTHRDHKGHRPVLHGQRIVNLHLRARRIQHNIHRRSRCRDTGQTPHQSRQQHQTVSHHYLTLQLKQKKGAFQPPPQTSFHFHIPTRR